MRRISLCDMVNSWVSSDKACALPFGNAQQCPRFDTRIQWLSHGCLVLTRHAPKSGSERKRRGGVRAACGPGRQGESGAAPCLRGEDRL